MNKSSTKYNKSDKYFSNECLFGYALLYCFLGNGNR